MYLLSTLQHTKSSVDWIYFHACSVCFVELRSIYQSGSFCDTDVICADLVYYTFDNILSDLGDENKEYQWYLLCYIDYTFYNDLRRLYFIFGTFWLGRGGLWWSIRYFLFLLCPAVFAVITWNLNCGPKKYWKLFVINLSPYNVILPINSFENQLKIHYLPVCLD